MMEYIIRQINEDEYEEARQLDSDAFKFNGRDSDAEFHRKFADNIRKSPYFIQELDLVAVTSEGVILGHGIFSALPMGDEGRHVIWLNSLAIRYSVKDNISEKKFEYQRKGIGTAIVMYGFNIAKSLGYTACMTCGHPSVYQKKMRFKNHLELGIEKDDSVKEPSEAVFAIEFYPGGFEKTNKLLSHSYYDFEK